MSDIILVKGNIIAKSGTHVFKDLIYPIPEQSNDDYFDIIHGDLILEQDSKIIPYCVYVATGNTYETSKSEIRVLWHPFNLHMTFVDEINKLKDVLNNPISPYLQGIQNRLIYIGVIGALELFLSELLWTLVIGDKNNYNSFIKCSKYKVPLCQLNPSAIDIQKIIHEAIYDITAHNLKSVANLFKEIFDIPFPDFSKLGDKIKMRHDIAHRCGHKVKEKTIERFNVTAEMVVSLMETCTDFAGTLMNNLEKHIKMWEQDIDYYYPYILKNAHSHS